MSQAQIDAILGAITSLTDQLGNVKINVAKLEERLVAYKEDQDTLLDLAGRVSDLEIDKATKGVVIKIVTGVTIFVSGAIADNVMQGLERVLGG
jgi:hypothetical protein